MLVSNYCCGLTEFSGQADPKGIGGTYGGFVTLKSDNLEAIKKYEEAGWKFVYEFPGRYANNYTMKMYVRPFKGLLTTETPVLVARPEPVVDAPKQPQKRKAAFRKVAVKAKKGA